MDQKIMTVTEAKGLARAAFLQAAKRWAAPKGHSSLSLRGGMSDLQPAGATYIAYFLCSKTCNGQGLRHCCDRETRDLADAVVVVEDPTQVVQDAGDQWRPGYTFIDPKTIWAHPFFIEALLQNAEPLWTLDEMLATLAAL